MGNSTGRRRDFPPGTPTIQREITFSVEEWNRIEGMAREKDIAPSKLIAESVLTDHGNMMESTAQTLIEKVHGLREAQSATCVEMKDVRTHLRMILEGVTAGVLDGLTPELTAQLQRVVEQMDENIPKLKDTRDLTWNVMRSLL